MATTLKIDRAGERFVLNGEPAFLLGVSYFGALGAPEEFIEEDLTDLKRSGVNCIRVWPTWEAFGHRVSAFDADGDELSPAWEKLLWLCELADKLHFVVDVAFARGEAPGGAILGGDEAHLNAVGILAEALTPYRNAIVDVAAEWNAPAAGGVSIAFVKQLRDRIKQADPQRLVTASHAGDVEPDLLYQYLMAAKVDFLAPHRPVGPDSQAQTEQKTRTLCSRMARLGKVVPVLYSQPLRRGEEGPQPRAEDFLTDLSGAISGGAAGWCFHNGPDATGPERCPRRCFDLRPSEGRLLDQLEDEERTVLRRTRETVGEGAS